MPAASTDPEEYGRFTATGLVKSVLGFTRAAGSGWLSQRLVFLLRRIAIRKLEDKPVDIEALGARMRLHPYQNVCEKRILFTPQFFDPQERAYLEQRLHDRFVFLDIGANIGGYALFVAAHAPPTARILAVEPQPKIFDRLTYNLKLNPFASVKAIACAVADKDGEVTLFIDAQNQGESSVKIISGTSSTRIQVPARTLLGLIEEEGFPHVDAIKLDTEGAEDLILDTFFRNAPTSLWPKSIILERGNSRWHVDLPGLLAAKGYKIVLTARNNMIFERA